MSESSRPRLAPRMGLAFALLLSAAVAGAGCNLLGDLTSPSSTSTSSGSAATSSTTFTGSLTPQSTSLFNFTVAQAGTVSVTLSNESVSVPVGLGVGTPTGASTCTLTTSNPTAVAGSAPQITVTENPGNYCVSVYDAGSVTGSVSFSVIVSHP